MKKDKKIDEKNIVDLDNVDLAESSFEEADNHLLIRANDTAYYDRLDSDDMIKDDDSFGNGIVLPILALRNNVLFPNSAMIVTVTRDEAKALVRDLSMPNIFLAVALQREDVAEYPWSLEELYEVGTMAVIKKIFEHPDGTVEILLNGMQRFQFNSLVEDGLHRQYPRAIVNILSDRPPRKKDKSAFNSLLAMIDERASELAERKNIKILEPQDFFAIETDLPVFSRQISKAAGTLVNISPDLKQEILEKDDLYERAEATFQMLDLELRTLHLEEKILQKTRGELDKQHTEYFLQQQMRFIQEELSELGVATYGDSIALKKRAKAKEWSKEVAEIFDREVSKLERMNPSSPDYAIQLQYCETLLSLPWQHATPDTIDLKKAERILNRDHFGLKEVKQRILDHIAVLKLKGEIEKAPILCFYGAPGVGKTSLGKSIAESLGRKYVRISLGGMHDEAEIRGHRRTYIGAMPGRIIQGLKKAGSANPVFVLDEIDKIDAGFRGDPASALLEVLDPEQNKAFHDNYIDIDVDLSKSLFIATANDISKIHPALLDRMELIEVSGYTDEEKEQIAKKFLLPKILKEYGLHASQFSIDKSSLKLVIERYTRESGVRQLDKALAKLVRRSIHDMLSKEQTEIVISSDDLSRLLGLPLHERTSYQGNDYAGVVVGLAWTSVGGEILYVESSMHEGKDGRLTLTGNLGDVMKESATLALDYIKSHRQELGISSELLENKEIHIHVPEGAVPKDGPSAGVTIVTSLVSLLKGKRVRPNLAMTGEITLRGKVLAVGGIKEKILAAKRAGIKEIILSRQNQQDIEDIDSKYIKGLKFHYVDDIMQLIELAVTNLDALK